MNQPLVKMTQFRPAGRWLLVLWAAAPALGAAPLETEEIAPGIFVHQGVHEEISAANRGDIANIGFIVGRDCVAVVDTGGSPAIGAALREAVRVRTDVPICYVINTHMHPDHVLGNAAFVASDVVFVAHARLPAALAARAEHYLAGISRALGRPLGPEAIVLPQQTVDASLELDLGGRVLRLTAHRTAHTDNDLSVLDMQTRTLWLGDLVFMERVPALDGSILGWLSVLEELRATHAARVVPGHGPLTADWPRAAAPLEHYLRTLTAEIRTIIRRGGTIEEAIAQVGLSERERWRLFDDYHQRNVTAAFAELEWEDQGSLNE
jgi:quinoprotein relay system zinc metallohydrolase 2